MDVTLYVGLLGPVVLDMLLRKPGEVFAKPPLDLGDDFQDVRVHAPYLNLRELQEQMHLAVG